MGFNLTRSYSLSSLLGIAVIAVALGFFYRAESVENIRTHIGVANSELAQILGNTLWNKYNLFGHAGDSVDPGMLNAIDAEVGHKLHGLNVLKVIIFDSKGGTLYSSEHGQIGEQHEQSEGLAQALAGQSADQLIFRERFRGLGGERLNRYLIASYVPMRSSAGQVSGIFEIYTDVTNMVRRTEHTALKLVLVVTVLLLALYLFLMITIRRADRLLQAHKQAEHEERERRLSYLTLHDALTGLPNRKQFNTLLERAVERAERGNTQLAVMLVGLDRFRAINDSLGHEVGDQVLVQTAEWLGMCIHGNALFGRVGDDEFAIVVERLLSSDEASLWAKAVMEQFATPMTISERQVKVSLSIGIALYPINGEQARHLINSAAAALHKAKEQGRSRAVFYTEDLNSRALERLELEMDLRRAIEDEEFALFYQPRVDLNGRVLGMEALLRWEHPQRGMISPAHFIPMLEESGLIVPVGEWALREACRQCQAWRATGHEKLQVSVNLSLKQFQDGTLVETVRNALDESELPAANLELELTETALAEDSADVGEQLSTLKTLGVAIALDDFGTGYSSLSYLMHFPIDKLKIDRSFVHDIASNSEHLNLTKTIILMGRSLGIGVVAEGVETVYQLEILGSFGCDEIQGFYYSRPQPADRFLAVVAAIAEGEPEGVGDSLLTEA